MSSRNTDKDIENFFIDRWSPRSFDSQFELTDAQIESLIEAARWSPSCFNEQPWRFVYSKRQDSSFESFLSLLADANQKWARNASALFFLIAQKRFSKNDKINNHNRFDSGAAWMSLAIQSHLKGLITHAMAGVNFDKVPDTLEIPEDSFEVVCAIALGRQGAKNQLPEDIQESEQPNQRKPLNDILFKERFKKP